MKHLYIFSGCNGAGKTTTAYNMLPFTLNCMEFVNADEIARGLSPLQPEKHTYQSGKIMSVRIHELIEQGETFAVETTLSALTYKNKILYAKEKGYLVSLIYFWLANTELARMRVNLRVKEGGHNIETPVIIRRYYKGLKNFFEVYSIICDHSLLFDNSDIEAKLVMEVKNGKKQIYNHNIYKQIYQTYERTRN